MRSNTNLEPIHPAKAKEMYLSQREEEVSQSTIQAHHYRLKHFVRWCREVAEIDNLNELSARGLQQYRMWRREDGDLNNVTMVTQLSTLRVFVRWCENIDAVESGIHDTILLPSLEKTEDRRTAMLSEEAAKQLLEYLRQFEYATRTHALIEVLWHTGIRIGAAHSLDIGDYDGEEQYLELHHRPETGTRLKNKTEGERYLSLSADVCDALDGYLQYNREEGADDEGRNPLFSSRSGRPAKSTLRDSIYRITRPCEYTGECPHDREIDSCEALENYKASTCPSSVSPHAIRRGSITHHLSVDVPQKVVSDRMNVSLDVLEKHYDRRGEQKKAEQRRDHLRNI
ncbi:site-specific integrase [Halorubrum sp. Ea8]|uniref:tyrosine-type recombinase/integrase n=1 Tax=Halorubrum sp. Ea8 TaxID=1383841 RepID=UPI000B98DD98|nr:site-specific integrase [Halorubrum sp. Ea8]OYR50043.1 integrase [Halorubrum sp. Ea8]